MVRKCIKRITSLALTAAMLVCGSFTGGTAVYAAEQSDAENNRLTTNYTNVSSGYTEAVYSGDEIIYKISDVVDRADRAFLTKDNYEYTNEVLAVKAGDSVKLTIDVPVSGRYVMSYDYLSYDESILPVEMGMKIDGQYPFYEARSMKFETTWVSDGVDVDRYGNEIVALPDKLIQWEHKEVMDASYRYSDPLHVELTAGVHELELNIQEGTLLLGNITLSAPVTVPEYTGSQKAEGSELIVIEAEDFYQRNDSSIHAIGEYGSSLSPLSTTTTGS